MKALGIVFSNLHDKNIPELTARRTLASVPFGSRYRLVDFVLSSMVNSGVEKVGIITKNNYQSLMDHVGSGKHWDLARKNGGLMVLPPFGGSDSNQLYTNRLEALQGIKSFLKRSKEEMVIMSDCDNVANVNYQDVIKRHLANNADITLIYRHKVVTETKKMRCVLEMNASQRVTRFMVDERATGMQDLYMNMMVIRRDLLINILEQANVNGEISFSRDILSKKTDMYRIFAYKFEGYFASIDSVKHYFKHNMDMLDKASRDSLFHRDSPVFTKTRDSAPTIYAQTAHVSNAMVADGCRIEGTVRNSILFRGVHVAKGAVVENCILMQDTSVSVGASVSYVIADKNVVVKEKRMLCGCEELPFFIGKSMVL